MGQTIQGAWQIISGPETAYIAPRFTPSTLMMGRLRRLGPLAVLGYLAARRNALAQRALARIRTEIAPVD